MTMVILAISQSSLQSSLRKISSEIEKSSWDYHLTTLTEILTEAANC